MYTRKLVKAGPSSHTIALPKEWISKNNLKKGDIVYVADADNKLVLSPKETTEQPLVTREKLIEVDNKTIETIQREITSAYLNNYSLITLSGASIIEKAKAIREVVHNFVALEITEQSSKKISAKDFLNLNEISIDKTVKRIDMMIRTMFEDLFADKSSKLQASIDLRDEDINRLYFLLVRLLKNSLVEQKIAKQLALANKEILSYWQIVHDLENIADCIKKANEIITTSAQSTRKEIIETYKSAQKSYNEAITAYYQNDKSFADKIVQQCIILLNKQTTSNKPAIAALSQNINLINTHVINIARQVIDAD